MPATHGQFVWYELSTPDTEAAATFYATVMGWSPSDVPDGPMPYKLFNVGDAPSAGMMSQMDDALKAGVPPAWLGYVHVDDVDAAAAKAIELDGRLYHGPTEIPGVCRFAVLADPHSAAVGIMKWASPGPGDAPPRPPVSQGFAGWQELMTRDWRHAFDFHAALFGWTKGDAIDIGEMGTYQLFTTGGTAVGGMFNKPDAVPAPCWLYYFSIGPIADAAKRVTDAGGNIVTGPMEVPGGAWIVQCTDPQGAMFALVGSGPA
jgi:uncharacterized protein